MDKLKMWVEISNTVNGRYEELVDLPEDWDQWTNEARRAWSMEIWEGFRDDIANGGFALVHENGELEDL
jgi:hypothetical protein